MRLLSRFTLTVLGTTLLSAGEITLIDAVKDEKPPCGRVSPQVPCGCECSSAGWGHTFGLGRLPEPDGHCGAAFAAGAKVNTADEVW